MHKWSRRVIVWLTPKGVLRLGAGILVFAVASILLTKEFSENNTLTYFSLPLSGMVIGIDAGHGGVDGGAVSKRGAIEKDLNLTIALYLRDYLQQAGAIVVMTREGDYDLAEEDINSYKKRKTQDLLKRVDLLREANPELIVSIHMNSIKSEKWSGAQTFYHSEQKVGSEKLAQSIQSELIRNLENTERQIATNDSVYILKAIQDIPTALVEVGFMSHPKESELLTDAQYQRMVAASVYQGILNYVAAP